MSRQRSLIDQLNNTTVQWETGLFINNIPPIMLENDFVRSLCVIINSTLLQGHNNNMKALHMFDISQNQ